MNLKECREEALKLINRYSVAGTNIAPSYNNQSDYLLKTTGLINDAQMEIAKTNKRLYATYTINQTADPDAIADRQFFEYPMPSDFYYKYGKGTPLFVGQVPVNENDFFWRGTTLLLRRDLGGEFLVEYYRYPALFTADTAETTSLDNTVDTHQAIPYFVASGLCRQDDPSLSATLYNIFETRVARLSENGMDGPDEIGDVYGFFLFGG